MVSPTLASRTVISAGVVAFHDSESAKQFQALVRKPAKAANGKTAPMPGSISGKPPVVQTDEIAEVVSAAFPMPQVFPKSAPPRVGQRAPERDPVGTSAPSVRKAYWVFFYRSDWSVACGGWKKLEFHILSVQPVWR